MSKYKAVIFDLDGTLLNTIDDLASGVNHVLEKNGMPRHTVEEVKYMVGNGVERLMRLAVPKGTSEQEQSELLAQFREYYISHSEIMTKPYDGIEKMLLSLRGENIKTAVASNKFDAAVKKLCEKYFPHMIDFAVGESADTPKKPDPTMIKKAMAALGTSESETLYVGDSDVDIMTAKNAGLSCVSCTWGFRERDFLAKQREDRLGYCDESMMIDSPSELFSVIG